MSAPPRAGNTNEVPQRPEPTALQPPSGLSSHPSSRPEDDIAPLPKKKRNHRGGKKKKRPRRQSFAASTEDGSGMPETSQSNVHHGGHTASAARESFYRVQGRNLSGTSIESEALLDHRWADFYMIDGGTNCV